MHVDSLFQPEPIERTPSLQRIFFMLGVLVLGVIVAGFALSTQLNDAPDNFPTETDIVIAEGLTENDVTKVLAANNVVRSSLYLYMVLRNDFKNAYVQAGTYRFNSPKTTAEVAGAITKGDSMTPLIKVTFPEGFTAKQFTQYLPPSFTLSDIVDPIQSEGYLFPDTYFISNATKPSDLITLLHSNFDKKIKPYTAAIKNSGFTENEVIILASIIEREAKDVASKKMISGVLQNRLHINMPLQVDAAFDYILNKESSELTDSDLAIDSPYNTYTHTGLPPTPISNPGLEAIDAVLNPTPSDYLYYLTAPDGTFHYARTFEAHKQNKARYLR